MKPLFALIALTLLFQVRTLLAQMFANTSAPINPVCRDGPGGLDFGRLAPLLMGVNNSVGNLESWRGLDTSAHDN